MAECAKCMFDNPAGAAACEQCGADLDVEVLSLQLGEVCRACDSYNDPGVRVCVSCGEPLGTVSDAEPTGPEKTIKPGPDSMPPALPAEIHDPHPTPMPWMAPPDTGEYNKEAALKAAASAGSTPPPAQPAARPAAAGPGAGGASALPPGWGTPATRAAPAAKVAKDTVPCPKCQSPNPPTARYCGSCGQGLTPAGSKPRGKIILIRGISGEGRQFPLTGANLAVGRTGAVAFPEDPYVGQPHATFYFRGDDLAIQDEGSANGVYIRLRDPQPLKAGDMFSIGEHLLRYSGPTLAQQSTVARHGSPRTADRLQVIEEILEGGGIGRVCKRGGATITLGRAGCDLSFPTDGFVSARHAELTLNGEMPFLRDLGSANGTFLRVPPRTDRVLKHGDYLLIGRELLRVEVAAVR